MTEGTTARYKVREQLAGVSFPSDAVDHDQRLSGVIVVNPDGSINAGQSKITVDLRTIRAISRCDDGYIQSRTLETEKFPTLELVPRRAVGLPAPLPAECPRRQDSRWCAT